MNNGNIAFSGIYEPLDIVYCVNNNKIIIWNYKKQQDIIIFDKITSPIICLHFTQPKKEIFSDEIKYIAVACTSNNLYIILITVENQIYSDNINNKNHIKLMLSNYSVGLSNTVNSIVSTGKRRIFIGSDNNNLFELNYTVKIDNKII